MTDFIKHGSFILRLSEIKYASLIEETKVKVVIESKGEEKYLIMDYLTEYHANEALNKLTLQTEACDLKDWHHPFIQQLIYMRVTIHDVEEQMKKLQKEFSMVRKQLKQKKNNDQMDQH